MRDFQQKPSQTGVEYALFLIRSPEKLTKELLDNLHQAILNTDHIVTLERLFKGSRSALVIFGPKPFLQKASEYLNLLELEEYSKTDPAQVVAWEVGTKDEQAFHQSPPAVFANLPTITDTEELWMQLVLRPTEKNIFETQMRWVFISPNAERRVSVPQELGQLDQGKLVKLPRPYTSTQILGIYQDRSKVFADTNLKLSSEEVLNLAGVSPK